MSSKWRRFEVLLPLQFNDGREVPSDWLAEAVLEVVDHFGAARLDRVNRTPDTANRAIPGGSGTWTPRQPAKGFEMPTQPNPSKRQCTLLFFLATPAEEEALKQAAKGRGLPFERIKDAKLGQFHWLGTIGNETVIAIRPSREGGRVVMGALGRLGSAAKAIRFQEATGARGIVQVGMAFGIAPQAQKLGDVLVSTSIIPYDNRDIRPAPDGSGGYIVEYPEANPQPARPSLVNLFVREKKLGGHSFGIHVGAILSGGARINSGRFRDELVRGIPAGEDPIVGGEMEGVGLLAASTAADDPIWCVVKGISDFADENRDAVIDESRPRACRNAAEFVLSALENDARD
jgi:nucleoside phosphorylase